MKKILIYLLMVASIAFSKSIDDEFTNIDSVEEIFLKSSKRSLKYPGENIPVIVTENSYSLGKLAALHFINWIMKNPNGVIALPSGKTPEYFIKYLCFYKKHWKEQSVQNELKKFGIENEQFPDTSNLKFVQIDEFFPIDTSKPNSFTHFINKYYISLLGLKKENLLIMENSFVAILKKYGIENVFSNTKIDLKMLAKEPMTYKDDLQQKAMQEIFAFCNKYEKKIKKWGGIGFFLGGIGPDGYIAFNQKGSWHNSKTRLVKLNYKAAAVYATNLGGIENSSEKYAITIGLDTICFNKNAEIIILASGENKGEVVAKAIESGVSLDHPATAFHKMSGAKFYITKGCEKYLNNRKHLDYLEKKELPLSFIQDTIIEISLLKQKPVFNLTSKDMEATPSGSFLMRKIKSHFKEMKLKTQKMLIEKVENKINPGDKVTILHTSPHQADVFLSYYPLASKLIGNYENIFCAITSGFNSVTNMFLKDRILEIRAGGKVFVDEISHDYQHLIFLFKKAYISKSFETQKYLENCLISKKIAEIYKVSSEKDFMTELDEIIHYLDITPPGQKDIPQIQALKGAIREIEEEMAWYVTGIPLSNIIHMRALFYTGSVFTPHPEDIDIKKMSNIIKKTNPDIISLAFDPEGTGPDTNFKSLKLISSALSSIYRKNISIWGYLNVWHRFNFSQANLFYLVSREELDSLNRIYHSCYSSQNEGSFPSSNFDGPFCLYTEKIEEEQLQHLKVLLGENFFKKHLDKQIRNAKGLILIKQMTLDDFFSIVNDQTNELEEKTPDFHNLSATD